MNDQDLIHRFLFENTDVRGEIVSINTAFVDAVSHQDIPATLLPLFGEFLASAALLSEVLKFEGILTLQARSEGDIAIVMAESTENGDLRGILQLSENADVSALEHKPFVDLFRAGVLTITVDPNKGQRYQGIVPLEGDSLSRCLENYFLQSEQLPTHIQLFANNEQCAGLFLQCLPAKVITDAERREDLWQTSTQLAATVSADELFSLSHKNMLTRLFHELNCRIFEPKVLRFKCSCTRDRSANALRSIGYSEALQLLQERNSINIDCQFCGKHYQFSQQDLSILFPDEHSIH